MLFLKRFLPLIILISNSPIFSSPVDKCERNFLPNQALFLPVRNIEQPLNKKSIETEPGPDLMAWKSEHNSRILSNILRDANIDFVGELVTKTEKEVENLPWPRKTENMMAIKEWLSEKGLHLGMKMDWPLDKESVEALLKQLSKEDLQSILDTNKHMFVEDRSWWEGSWRSILYTWEEKEPPVTYNTVWAEVGDIQSLGDLVTKTEEELLALPGFGQTNLRKMKAIVTKRGLHLGMKVNWPLEPRTMKVPSPEELKTLLSRTVTSLDWVGRNRWHIQNVLLAEGVLFVGDLVAKTEEELLAIHPFNKTNLEEVKGKLARNGLQLGMKVEWPPDEKTLDTLMREKLHKRDLQDVLPELLKKSKAFLATSAWQALTEERILSFGDLVAKTEEELLAIPSFNKRDLIKVKAELAVRGLGLGMKIDWPVDKESAEAQIKQLPKEVLYAVLARYPLWRLSLNLSTKTDLIKSGFLFVGDLIVTTEEELLERTGFEFGTGSLSQVKKALGERGLKLGMEFNPPLKSKELEELGQRVFKEEMEAALSQSVETLYTLSAYAYSLRVQRSLENAGIQTLRDLVVKTDHELYQEINMTKKHVTEIKNNLSKRGLYLGMKPEDFTL